MTRDDATECIVLLCAALHVRVPHLDWTGRSRNGRYYTRRLTVQVGPNCWRGVEAALLHEIAHHVANCRYGDHGHGPTYYRALCEVISLWYTNPGDYPWCSEYKSLAHAAGVKKTA